MDENKTPFGVKYRRIIKFLTVLIGILLAIYLLGKINILPAFEVLITSLQALIFGIFFACLLNPLVKGIENLFKKHFPADTQKKKSCKRHSGYTFNRNNDIYHCFGAVSYHTSAWNYINKYHSFI